MTATQMYSHIRKELSSIYPNTHSIALHILKSVINTSLVDIFLYQKLSVSQIQAINKIISAVKNGTPLEYILGYTEFMGIKLKITKGVFIPRPETEMLVEKAILYIKNRNIKEVLEIGTGSGNIVCGIALHCKCKITSCEINPTAIEISKQNISKYSLDSINIIPVKNTEWEDWNIPSTMQLLITNPPYIGWEEYPYLSDLVKSEPKEALFSTEKGLYIIKKIIKFFISKFPSSSRLYMEIGYKQKEIIKNFLLSFDVNFWFEKDLSNIYRYLIIEK